MRILNLTQHAPSEEQQAAGVFDASPEDRAAIVAALNFSELPSSEDIADRARDLAVLAISYEADAALIGGAPFLMGHLERTLKVVGLKPLYAFSRRESVENTLPDGSVRKVVVFRHLGFVEA